MFHFSQLSKLKAFIIKDGQQPFPSCFCSILPHVYFEISYIQASYPCHPKSGKNAILQWGIMAKKGLSWKGNFYVISPE